MSNTRDDSFAWGTESTRFFYDLTPERVLDAVESAGFQCTGLCFALNSMENRVYEVEIELDERPAIASERFRIVKFYRPGRWSEAQIREEHRFLADLKECEIPVISPLEFPGGDTLRKTSVGDIYYTLFPKVGGRSPDEFNDDQLEQVGRLLARIHTVGASREAASRIRLTPATYGLSNLESLLSSDQIPREHLPRYEKVVRSICEFTSPWFEKAAYQRIHGDCHKGNLLWNKTAFFLDFDDMVRGPAVQDLWLLVPGRDEEALEQRRKMIAAYEQMREFDYREIRLIEPLRALRFIHFSAWISKRWEDPAFPRSFPHFGTEKYWAEQVQDLETQWRLIQESAAT